jgi:16S rRNA (adenine1518-N6/adenine1519-N6)-dimethyltransferase
MPASDERPSLSSPATVRRLLNEAGHRPSKSLGQNYLIDGNIVRIITEAVQVQPDEPVLEIGPGLGVLTAALLEAGAQVTAIEKDPAMTAHLRHWFENRPIRLIEADALDCRFDELLQNIPKVAANLPYSVGSRILVELIECRYRPQHMVLMLQQEVAERIAAPVGSSAYGPLAVWTGLFYTTRRIKSVSPNCFLPPPKVRSAVLALERRDAPAAAVKHYPRFKAIVKTAFGQRRKKLTSTLRTLPGFPDVPEQLKRALCALEISPDARPAELTVPQWVALADRFPAPASNGLATG